MEFEWDCNFYVFRAKERILKERELFVYMRDKAEDLSLGNTTEEALHSDPILLKVKDTIREEEELKSSLRKFTNISSEIGDVRAISSCAFQPTDTPGIIATGSWTGNCKLWNVSSMTESLILTG